jgi:flagellar basal body-associated protein FliL
VKRLIVPILLALFGLTAGAGAGYMLRPAPAPDAVGDTAAKGEHGGAEAHDAAPSASDKPTTPREYVRLNNQFIVPLVEQGRVSAMVIMALSVEIEQGQAALVYAQEPKLRDALLQAMFQHANAGGFRGSFTDTSNMRLLRQLLREEVRGVLGAAASDVFITDIVRQDT